MKNILVKNIAKISLLAVLILVATATATAQGNNRKSPPAKVTKTIDGVTVTINYSRPYKNGREIFGGLVPYGKVWRTGADEASWIEVSEDVMVNAQKLEAGTYALFTIPDKDEWTVIFNKEWKGAWGAYAYDQKADVLRVTTPPEENEEATEQFTISIEDDGTVRMAWDQTVVPFRLKSVN